QAPPVAGPHDEQDSDHRDDAPARPGGERARDPRHLDLARLHRDHLASRGAGRRGVWPPDARQDAPRAVRSGGGHCERCAVPRLRRELLHNGHRPRSRWRHKGLVTAVVVPQKRGPMPAVDASAEPAAQRRRPGFGFWAVAFAFLIVTAFATVPSPLYGLYRTRDNLSAFT